MENLSSLLDLFSADVWNGKSTWMWSSLLLVDEKIHIDFHELQVSLRVHQNFRACSFTVISCWAKLSSCQFWCRACPAWEIISIVSGTPSRKNSPCITWMATIQLLRKTSTKCVLTSICKAETTLYLDWGKVIFSGDCFFFFNLFFAG